MSQSRTSFFFTAYFIADGDRLHLAQFSQPQGQDSQAGYSRVNDIPIYDIEAYLRDGIVRVDEKNTPTLPTSLSGHLHQFGCESAVYLPVVHQGQLRGLLMIGAPAGEMISDDVIDTFQRTIRLTTHAVVEPPSSPKPIPSNDRHALETRALNILASNAATLSDLRAFYTSIHDQVRAVVGETAFLIAIYDAKTNSISLPYVYENGEFSSLDTFPLGEGLTSLLIRTREPLMIVEDMERRAPALGAKVAGQPSKSWLGVPMLARGEAVGAIIVQDLEREHRYNETDLRFVIAVASQVASTIHNARILNESQQIAIQFETASEIARDISSSLDLDELLQKAVDLIRARFHFYHASIFLKDLPEEFVVIRGSTGEAGAALKRAGHKLGVGSKSIVGHVAEKGEILVVNDTTRDATYYPNAVLPDTRSEAALPLKVAGRILGVMDVQSDKAFAFSDDNLKILQILTDQLAVAVVNSELFAETQEHLAQHRLLHHITTTAASGTTLDEALQSAVNGLQVTLGGDRVSILLVDRDRKTLEVRAAVGYAEDIFKIRIPVGEGVTGWTALHRRPIRIHNVLQDSRYIEGSSNTRSEMAIPLLYRSELLGVLNVESEQVGAYAENDEELLGTLGGSLAAIIANARLLEQIRSQAERERIIYEITDKIRRTTDMQTILATTASELTRAIGASSARIKLGSPTPEPANHTENTDNE